MTIRATYDCADIANDTQLLIQTQVWYKQNHTSPANPKMDLLIECLQAFKSGEMGNLTKYELS